ncbi:hypothetical protein MA04_01687 [Alcanivorax balearicus MACL04]|uniref:DUF2946 domain-containing protein n=1 Tax=Alloalcanivorax balearicus MACL04 TaxID=1177182 RepID=A0ABT2QY00_9GAMM|nr:hypothetical protein [Alloalcanivorax balearicus]MCU5782387.1 hypothetical protein [Alloalcanivorax balearicus MACL04]
MCPRSARAFPVRLLLLSLLLIAGQWQMAWHTTEHLPTATSQAGDIPDDGGTSAAPHCQHCAPVQIAVPPATLVQHNPAAEPFWRPLAQDRGHTQAGLRAYLSRAPPLST